MQPTIQLYRDQHQRALQCAEDISKAVQSKGDIHIVANEIRLSLAQLAGTLKPHLVSEDRLLYPTLMASKNPKTAETATRFWNEMGGIAPVVNQFLTHWREPGEIEKNYAKFMTESQAIFTALKNRIEAEEKDLYPLFLAENP